MEIIVVMSKNHLQLCTAIELILINRMLSERSQIQNSLHSMILYIEYKTRQNSVSGDITIL